MIARIWHGMVPVSKADEYLDLMRRIALPDYLATRGNRGAWCLYRTEADVTHFEMLTFWEDTDAIKRFAALLDQRADRHACHESVEHQDRGPSGPGALA